MTMRDSAFCVVPVVNGGEAKKVYAIEIGDSRNGSGFAWIGNSSVIIRHVSGKVSKPKTTSCIYIFNSVKQHHR